MAYFLDGNGQNPYMDEGYVGITEGGGQGGDQFQFLLDQGGDQGDGGGFVPQGGGNYVAPGDKASERIIDAGYDPQWEANWVANNLLNQLKPTTGTRQDYTDYKMRQQTPIITTGDDGDVKTLPKTGAGRRRLTPIRMPSPTTPITDIQDTDINGDINGYTGNGTGIGIGDGDDDIGDDKKIDDKGTDDGDTTVSDWVRKYKGSAPRNLASYLAFMGQQPSVLASAGGGIFGDLGITTDPTVGAGDLSWMTPQEDMAMPGVADAPAISLEGLLSGWEGYQPYRGGVGMPFYAQGSMQDLLRQLSKITRAGGRRR